MKDLKSIAKEIYFNSNKTPESFTSTDVSVAMDALGFSSYEKSEFQDSAGGSIKQPYFNRIAFHMWAIDDVEGIA